MLDSAAVASETDKLLFAVRVTCTDSRPALISAGLQRVK